MFKLILISWLAKNFKKLRHEFSLTCCEIRKWLYGLNKGKIGHENISVIEIDLKTKVKDPFSRKRIVRFVLFIWYKVL